MKEREREWEPHCRDRNPEIKLGIAEARAGRCCQTLCRAPGLGEEHIEGALSTRLALSRVHKSQDAH